MKPQAILRFASFFAVNLTSSLHAASVIQFSATSFTVAENVGQPTLHRARQVADCHSRECGLRWRRPHGDQ